MINDNQRLVSACHASSRYDIPVYDDGFGPLWISRNSISINGIVRARTWEDAYSICKDEFFPEAAETIDDFVREYGFTREYHKVVKDYSVLVASEHLNAGERLAVYPDDYPNGRLKPEFVRCVTIETPAPDAWSENELFCEAFGFRPNGPNERDTLNHGIYVKDLNGDYLDLLTLELIAEIGIELTI